MPYYTAQDVCDFLMTGVGGGAQDGEHRAIRAAVHHAYREVCESRDWLWHVKTGSFWTNGGTFTVYGHNGTSTTLNLPPNCNEFLSAGMSISDPTTGRIPSGATITSVAANTSSIVVTIGQPAITVRQIVISATPTGVLSSVFVPTSADYDLPVEVENMDSLLSQTVGTIRNYVTPTDYQRLIVNLSTAGDPYYFTVMRVGDKQNLTVRFVGAPTAQLRFYYTYRKRPTPLVLMGFEPPCRQGTVTITGGTAVAGSGTDFPTRAAGAVLRLSGNATNYPESLFGLYPYESEELISARASTTAMTLAASTTNRSGVRYYISDLLDVSPGMYTAVLSAAEMWYARLVGKSANQAMAVYARDLKLAMEQDVTNPISGRREVVAEHPITPRTLGYYSTQLPDQG